MHMTFVGASNAAYLMMVAQQSCIKSRILRHPSQVSHCAHLLQHTSLEDELCQAAKGKLHLLLTPDFCRCNLC